MLDPESPRKAVEIQWRSPSENYRDESGLIQSLVGQVSPCAQCWACTFKTAWWLSDRSHSLWLVGRAPLALGNKGQQTVGWHLLQTPGKQDLTCSVSDAQPWDPLMKRSPHCKMPAAVRQAPLVGSVETLNSGHFHVQVPLLSQCRGPYWGPWRESGGFSLDAVGARSKIMGSLGSLGRQASTPSRQPWVTSAPSLLVLLNRFSNFS